MCNSSGVLDDFKIQSARRKKKIKKVEEQIKLEGKGERIQEGGEKTNRERKRREKEEEKNERDRAERFGRTGVFC